MLAEALSFGECKRVLLQCSNNFTFFVKLSRQSATNAKQLDALGWESC